MNIIPCSKLCKFQKDGYCNCDGTMVITNFVDNDCPFFCEREIIVNKTEEPKVKTDYQ